MSLFKKLFSADPAGLEKKADALYASGDYGPAKLTYERALAASPQDAHAPLGDKIRQCTDGIARERIEEAKAYLAQGSIELAEQELEGALEVAADDALREEAQGLLDGLEAKEAQKAWDKGGGREGRPLPHVSALEYPYDEELGRCCHAVPVAVPVASRLLPTRTPSQFIR